MKFQEIVHKSLALTQVFSPSLLSPLPRNSARSHYGAKRLSQAPSPSTAPSRCGVGKRGEPPDEITRVI